MRLASDSGQARRLRSPMTFRLGRAVGSLQVSPMGHPAPAGGVATEGAAHRTIAAPAAGKKSCGKKLRERIKRSHLRGPDSTGGREPRFRRNGTLSPRPPVREMQLATRAPAKRSRRSVKIWHSSPRRTARSRFCVQLSSCSCHTVSRHVPSSCHVMYLGAAAPTALAQHSRRRVLRRL